MSLAQYAIQESLCPENVSQIQIILMSWFDKLHKITKTQMMYENGTRT